MRIQCSGEIVMDEDKWLYDWCEIPSFSPGDLRNAIEKLADGEELVVEINSPGGVCYSGFEIYSVLRGCGHPTVGEVQGMAASAASTILMGCETRRVSPVGQVMIHDPLICARGNAAALRETAKYLDSVKESILNAYELRCREKCGRAKIAQLMSEETWMTAQDAVALGFADEIILAEGEGAEGTLPTTAAANSVTNGLNLHNVDVLLQQYEDAVRSGGYITYFKQSEAIEDVLTTIGAPLAAMGIMQAKMQKDMRNAVNRRVNCDSANADKIVLAAQEQLDAIRELDRKYGLDTLPDILQETAMLRIANPESSLSDLARLASPPVSKSCMSHRLKKLLEYKGD